MARMAKVANSMAARCNHVDDVGGQLAWSIAATLRYSAGDVSLQYSPAVGSCSFRCRQSRRSSSLRLRGADTTSHGLGSFHRLRETWTFFCFTDGDKVGDGLLSDE